MTLELVSKEGDLFTVPISLTERWGVLDDIISDLGTVDKIILPYTTYIVEQWIKLDECMITLKLLDLTVSSEHRHNKIKTTTFPYYNDVKEIVAFMRTDEPWE